MYALCCYGDVYKEKFIELNGAVHLLAMISSRDNSGTCIATFMVCLKNGEKFDLYVVLLLKTTVVYKSSKQFVIKLV